MNFLFEALSAFLPGILEYIEARTKDKADHDLALMRGIAKVEDARAKAKFPDYQPPTP